MAKRGQLPTEPPNLSSLAEAIVPFAVGHLVVLHPWRTDHSSCASQADPNTLMATLRAIDVDKDTGVKIEYLPQYRYWFLWQSRGPDSSEPLALTNLLSLEIQ